MSFFFFFNDTATTEIYTLSLHDALPISGAGHGGRIWRGFPILARGPQAHEDRKSTRLNSSHQIISYAVFCLKKKTTECFYRWQTLATHLFNTGTHKSSGKKERPMHCVTG